MSLNGVFREAALKRWMDPGGADIVSAVLGAVIILLVTRRFFRPFGGMSGRELAKASLALLVLTVAFEFAVGRLVDNKTWAELLGNYAVWRGRLWPLLLLLVALTPFIWGRWFPERSEQTPILDYV
jgi:hypothetical protein